MRQNDCLCYRLPARRVLGLVVGEGVGVGREALAAARSAIFGRKQNIPRPGDVRVKAGRP